MSYNPEFTYKLNAARKDGLTFIACVFEVSGYTEFVREFDKLCGCNLSLKGAPIELMVDEATGKLESDMKNSCNLSGIWFLFGYL